jgi:hypothetical protein
LTAGRQVNSLQGSRSIAINPLYSSVYQALMIARPRMPLTYTKRAPISAAGSHYELARHRADPAAVFDQLLKRQSYDKSEAERFR